MTFNITTFSITTLNRMDLIVTFSKTILGISIECYHADCHYVKCLIFIVMLCVIIIDIESLESRLFKFCYVTATSAHLQRLLFLLWPLTVLMKQTRQAVCTVKQSILLRSHNAEKVEAFGIRKPGPVQMHAFDVYC
jgi:hypothetical protein